MLRIARASHPWQAKMATNLQLSDPAEGPATAVVTAGLKWPWLSVPSSQAETNMHRRTTPQNGMRGKFGRILFSIRCESDAYVGRGSIADTAGAGAHSAPARRPHPPKSDGTQKAMSINSVGAEAVAYWVEAPAW